jgi:pimeloyl-ACP methyl ester carboxylesterase
MTVEPDQTHMFGKRAYGKEMSSRFERSVMKKRVLATTTALMLTLFASACSTAPKIVLSETPITFEAGSGETVEALEGSFMVPENRTDPNSRMLTLHYVKFPATTPKAGPPIIYLAGGPGGSGIGTAKRQRFPLFMAMREFGDVIAFDQRGTGASNDAPTCKSSQGVSPLQSVSDHAYFEMEMKALEECLAYWKAEGIDVKGYTTPENVADLDDLRRHLGAEKITLWGTSYGSHLSFAAIKQIENRLDRIVISSAEGLDQTIKMPARTDDYFDRIQTAINSQPDNNYPDIKAMIRRVHAQLDATPLAVKIPQKDGSESDVLVTRAQAQKMASATISDPQWVARLLQVYKGLDEGNTGPLIEILKRWHDPKDDGKISFRPMSILMDVASGTGQERRVRIEEQAETSLLGNYLNHNVRLEDVDTSLNLGDAFRQKPVSDIPALLLSGTLDGRTYIESQRETVSGLSNRQMVTVRNAGHNLFMSSPEVTQTIQDFMRGQSVDGREIVVELPEFK